MNISSTIFISEGKGRGRWGYLDPVSSNNKSNMTRRGQFTRYQYNFIGEPVLNSLPPSKEDD